MDGLAFYVEEGISFAPNMSFENSEVSYFCFLTGSFGVSLLFCSMDHHHFLCTQFLMLSHLK